MGEKKIHPIDAWNSVQVFYVQELAVAYGELYIISETIKRLNEIFASDQSLNEDSREAFTLLLQMDALCTIKKDIGTWLEEGYFD